MDLEIYEIYSKSGDTIQYTVVSDMMNKKGLLTYSYCSY